MPPVHQLLGLQARLSLSPSRFGWMILEREEYDLDGSLERPRFVHMLRRALRLLVGTAY